MVAVITEENRLYWASGGDSRIYLLRGDEIKLVTRDHNYYLRLMQMVENGSMTKEEAMRREYAIKQLTRKEKLKLMEFWTETSAD